MAAEFSCKGIHKADGYCSISRGPETIFQLTQHNTETQQSRYKKIYKNHSFYFIFIQTQKYTYNTQKRKSYPTDEIYKMSDNIEQGQASLFSNKHSHTHTERFIQYIFL